MADDKELEQTQMRRSVRACCDIYEGDGSIVLRIEMPGVNKDNLNINVDGDVLTVVGKRADDSPPEGEYLIREMRRADYLQTYTLDETIDRNKIDATLSNGILLLTLGIKESEKPRKITVTAK
jgi:HSP20 family protein